MLLADVGPKTGFDFNDTQPRRRVLVVEDDASSREAMVLLFRKFGMEVSSAANLAEAMALLASGPDSIILDLMLPDGNGVDVLRRIREQRLPIRVAVATGVYDWHLLDEVRTLGPDKLFQKPVDVSELRKWLLET